VRRGFLTGVTALALSVYGVPAARATTAATLHSSLQPDRLGASAALTLMFGFSGGEEGVPAPLRGMSVRLPAGLRIDLRGVVMCAKSRLQRRGLAACPSGSVIGRGHALLQVHAGSQTVPEESAISVVRGPNRGADPTFEIFAHGETPLDQTTISTVIMKPDAAPYGSRLLVAVPPIPTLMLEPDASFSSMLLRIGRAAGGPRAHAAGAVLVPHSCPTTGFPVSAAFTFADGSTANASSRIPCP
jgi:hypothetical protein